MKFNQSLMSPFYRSYTPSIPSNYLSYPNMFTQNLTQTSSQSACSYLQNYQQQHVTGYPPQLSDVIPPQLTDVTSAPYNCEKATEGAYKDHVTSDHVIASESSPFSKEASLTSSAAAPAGQYFPVTSLSAHPEISSSYTPPSYSSYYGYRANAGTSSHKFTQHYYDTNVASVPSSVPASSHNIFDYSSKAHQAAFITSPTSGGFYNSYYNSAPSMALNTGYCHSTETSVPVAKTSVTTYDGRLGFQEGYYPVTNVCSNAEQSRSGSPNICIDL